MSDSDSDSTRHSVGEPPKPLDSNKAGDEDSDRVCIHSDDKPEPDGWLYAHEDCEESPREDGLGIGIGPDKEGAWCWACGKKIDMDNELGVESAESYPEPVFGLSTIRDTIGQKTAVIHCCPNCGEMGKPTELANGSYQCDFCGYGSGTSYKKKSEWELVRKDKVLEVFGRRTDEEKEGGGSE